MGPQGVKGPPSTSSFVAVQNTNSFLKTNHKDNFVGNWIGCGYNNGQEIKIELIDEDYIIKNKKYNSEWVFTKDKTIINTNFEWFDIF